MLNGATAHISDAAFEELPMADGTTLRLFTKLDEIQATGATTAADVARLQGGQKAIESHFETIRAAIGDVTQTKIEVARTTEKMANIENDLLELKTSLSRADDRAQTRSWVEPLVRWAVSALVGGSAIGAGAVAAQKVFGS